MASLVQCPHCSRNFSVADEMLGRSARCRGCGHKFSLLPSGAGSAPPGKAPSPVPVAADPGTVGPYGIREQLGEGAFGVVYRAHHPVLDREVALKVLRALSGQAVQRFLREARVLARLDHPNIVRVYDAGQHGNSYFIASALIRGNTLVSLIPAGGLDPVRAVRLVIQLVDALGYAHSFEGGGIIHRDVKPANAMVDGRDRLYLMDFGLAGWTDDSQARMTRDGAVMGTPAFMPPEQAAGETGRLGPASDLYSAGVVLYQLLTSRLPFEAPFPTVLYHVIHTPPPPPSEYRPGLDPVLEAICLRALAKEPADRYRDGQEFAGVLRRWLADKGQSPSAPVTAGGGPSAATGGGHTQPPHVFHQSTMAGHGPATSTLPCAPPPAGPAREGTGGVWSSKTLVACLAACLVATLLLLATVCFVTLSGKGKEPAKGKPGYHERLDSIDH